MQLDRWIILSERRNFLCNNFSSRCIWRFSKNDNCVNTMQWSFFSFKIMWVSLPMINMSFAYSHITEYGFYLMQSFLNAVAQSNLRFSHVFTRILFVWSRIGRRFVISPFLCRFCVRFTVVCALCTLVFQEIRGTFA